MAEELLTRLVNDASGGAQDMARLRSIVEEASAAGATAAMERLGLSDTEARRDLDELRDLLRAWRDAKSSAFKGVVQWVLRVIVALALFGLAAKFGIGVDGGGSVLPEMKP